MTVPVLIGCAGWSLSSKTADRFPDTGTHLQRYSAVFPAVEINSSFYRPHRPSTYMRWHDLVPEDFRFSVKIPRTITHQQRLQQTDALLTQFLIEASNLRDKLGCLLVQMPPSLAFDYPTATAFFTMLRGRVSAAIACEPRHISWFGPQASEMLSRLNIARVLADPPAVNDVDLHAAVASTTMYVRLHGSPVIYHSSYSDAYLIRLKAMVSKHVDAGGQAWCIFDNTASGAAVPNALSFLGLIAGKE